MQRPNQLKKSMTRFYWSELHGNYSNFKIFLLILFQIQSRQNFKRPYESMQRNLRQIRVQGLPKPPATCKEIESAFERAEIREKFSYTHHKDRKEVFYNGCYENKSFSYCVFSSKKSIINIQNHVPVENRTILMDATFAIVPLGCFTQILIIYASYSGKVIDLIRYFDQL